jgi:membrane protease YdiL (CAAX protease family)
MIGPILLAVSWFLLRLEGRGLDAIGINKPRKRALEFTAGFVALGAVAAMQQLGLSLVASDPFVVNADVDAQSLLNGLRFTVNSVLYEELVFRGYLLYRVIQWLGSRGAVWLAAGAFGVYHWFSYGVFGNLVPMVYVFLLTGMFGYLWARAFVVTGSVAAPIGLHLGWNAVAYLVFSAGPLGAGLLVPMSGAPSMQAQTLGASLGLSIALPVAATACGLWVLRRIERRTSAHAELRAGTG